MSSTWWRLVGFAAGSGMLLGFVLGGCAPVHFKTRRGVYHTVGKGETLWRICYAYQVNMKTVCRFNGIGNPEHIRVGQEIFIPGAERVRQVAVDSTRRQSDSSLKAREEAKIRSPPASSPRNVRRRSLPPADGAAQGPRRKAAGLEFVWPVRGAVTSWFGVRDGRRHDGIDIAAARGTPILAAEAGKVIYSDNGLSGYGNLIIIRHTGGFHTVYAHNSRNEVDVDDFVRKGQTIGRVGDTGRSRGCHLHFEIRKGQRAVDPMKYLP